MGASPNVGRSNAFCGILESSVRTQLSRVREGYLEVSALWV
jgi:hypothetical protein